MEKPITMATHPATSTPGQGFCSGPSYPSTLTSASGPSQSSCWLDVRWAFRGHTDGACGFGFRSQVARLSDGRLRRLKVTVSSLARRSRKPPGGGGCTPQH